MQLTFSPALGEIVPLVVRPGKPDALQETYFKATFDSIASYEHARSHGVRVEMWTDLPVDGRVRGEWAAVPFTFHEARSEEYGQARKVLSLPSFVDDSASEGLAVYAKLPVRLGHYHDGHQFSFTYRIVHASGDIRWLGAFGQNGTLVIDHKPLPEALGIALGEGWQFQEDGVAVLKGRPTNTQEVGKLLDSRAWSIWAIGRDSWPMFSRTCETQSCVALVLAPRPHRHAVMPNPPLVVSVSPGATVGLDAHGRIIYSSGNSDVHIGLRVIDDARFVALTDCDVQIRLLGSYLSPAFARIVACHAPGAALPLSILVLPSENGRISQEVPLDIDALAPVFPSSAPRTLVATTSDKQEFWVPSQDEHIMVSAGSSGGVALVAPLYNLATSEDVLERSWGVSVLQPNTTATVAVVEEEIGVVSQRLLPTPPPSPPVAMRAPQRPSPLALSPFMEVSETLSPMHTYSLSSAVPTPAPALISTSSTSAATVQSPTSYFATRPRVEADNLALVRLHSVLPLSSYVAALLGMFAWIWRIVFQRFAFLWLSAAGVQVSESGLESDEITSPLNSPQPEVHEEQQVNDDGESTGEDQATDVATLMDAPTPIAVETSVARPILQPDPQVPLATPKTIRSLPAINFDIPSHGGKIVMLVQAPEDTLPIFSRLRFVLNSKLLPEPHLSAKRNGYQLIHLDAPIDCESKLSVVLV